MKELKMLMMSGLVLGAGLMLNAADTAAKPAASAAPAAPAAQPAAPANIPVAKAFDFLPDTVAKINGVPVTKAELIAEFSKRLPNGVPAQMPPEFLKMQMPQIVEDFVTAKVMDKALADSKITVTAADVEKLMREELAGIPAEQRAMLEQQLKAQGKSIEDIIKMQSQDPNVQQQVKRMKFFEALAGKQSATVAEAEEYFKKNPDQFKQGASVDASHILIQVPANASQADWDKAKKEIDAIIDQLKKGADFGKLAEEKSACPSGKQAKGSLGKFGKGQMVPEFEKAAFALKKGELSGAVKTQYGYHVIKCNDIQLEKDLPFAEVKDQLVAFLSQQKQQQAVEKAVADLKKAAKVEIMVKAPAAPVAPAAPAAK